MAPTPFPTTLKRQTLAEQMADALKESILAGQWAPGEALPTEPDLAEQFGVSRAVVRDATRMLVARGLVDAQHGRGVFVTGSPVDAFGDALLLALRRSGATVWDVERFEQMVLPEVYAEAARQATAEDLATIRNLLAAYYAIFEEVSRLYWDVEAPAAETERVLEAARRLYAAVFTATHNPIWTLIAEPLARLKALRSWETGDMSVDNFIAHERRIFDSRLEALASRDPERAYAAARIGAALPAAAVEVMRRTPVGETPRIPAPLSH